MTTFISPLAARGLAREFHVSRWARSHYGFESMLFSLHGHALFADAFASQRAAFKINQIREAQGLAERVKPGELYAAGLLDEVLHLVMEAYREQVSQDALSRALAFVEVQTGKESLQQTLKRFADDFPATAVYQGTQTADDYLNGVTAGRAHREVVFEELLMLWLANENPAMTPFLDLLDDSALEEHTAYLQVIAGLETFFKAEPPLDADFGTLFEMLRAPALASPDSLEGQLEFIRTRWVPVLRTLLGAVLGDKFELLLGQLLQSLDVIKEEQGRGGPGGPPPARVIDFSRQDPAFQGRGGSKRVVEEYERFSLDRSWMPRVVMIAKSTYVWLGQLSKTYQTEINRLDQIPDAELDELARRGFTTLWLIGLWERSEASKRIKHLRGQPDAVASAYSLYDYEIAAELGGDAAYESLRDRAWQRGIRLASDMVPNHMGIDSRWVIEHPQWFLQVAQPPYPGYTFNGPDLSADGRVGIFLEDHYYDSSDAAVVFKRRDNATGSETFIYHGNDGTTMPWNDTAQLNYLDAEAREAVIQTILHVARKFPVIRFDAAMTLAKQHIQRLWYPEPGEGGAIPSRAQYGTMTAARLDQLMPEEFWREVVDRVAAELPDTLLLAEAFWMMEPYFVRTLGMHRVYNSAFMHMFMQERNAEYRESIKNTLEFDPQVLKRFVNFMNNPDEETAVAQFGDGDKYFGVATVMSTLPGLPMWGHGQVEGFHEKYGMEYRRAKWDESVNQGLIERHYRDIFPLLHRRAEFAEVENFLLFDLYSEHGSVNENVFAYSNRYGDKASLVLYNNKFEDARGWLKRSAAYIDKGTDQLMQRDLHEGLGIHGGADYFVKLREHRTGLEYLKRSTDLIQQGLFVRLGAYGCQVFVDVQEVHDTDGSYLELWQELGEGGVPDIEEERALLRLRDLHQAFAAAIRPDKFDPEAVAAFEAQLSAEGVALKKRSAAGLKKLEAAYNSLQPAQQQDYRLLLRAQLLTAYLLEPKTVAAQVVQLRLVRVLERVYKQAEVADAYWLAGALPLLARYTLTITARSTARSVLSQLLQDPAFALYLQTNQHDGVIWFRQEPYTIVTTALVKAAALVGKTPTGLAADFAKTEKLSGYQLSELLPKPKQTRTKQTSTPVAKAAAEQKKSANAKADAKKAATKPTATKPTATKASTAKAKTKASPKTAAKSSTTKSSTTKSSKTKSSTKATTAKRKAAPTSESTPKPAKSAKKGKAAKD